MDKSVVCKADTIRSSQSQEGRLDLNVAVIYFTVYVEVIGSLSNSNGNGYENVT